MTTIRVFLNPQPVKCRDGIMRYKASWVARGTSSTVYVSKTCDTREQAITLAKRYLASRPDLIDTSPRSQS